MDLTKAPIDDTIKKMAIPASIGLLFQALYNITDAYYVGQLSTTALAGLSVTFPVFFLLVSLGSGAGIAITALCAKAAGEKDSEKSLKFAMQGISFGIVISIIVALIGLSVSKYVFTALSGEGGVAGNAMEYMNVIYYGLPLFFLVFILNGILNSGGDTKTYGNALVIGFFLNIFLDPAFMYGWWSLPKMGVAGVALATVITQITTIIILMKPILQRSLVDLNIGKYVPDFSTWLNIAEQSIPATLGHASVSLGFLIVTRFVSDFGEGAIATFGIGSRIDQLIILPAIGIASAVIALIGQNYGAKKFDRVMQSYIAALKNATIFLFFGVLFVILFAPLLARIFTTDENVIKTTTDYLRISAFGYIAVAVFIISSSALQGLGKARHSLAINILRVVAIMLPAILFFAYFVGLRETGIWLGLSISAFIIAGVSYWYVVKSIESLSKKPAL